MCGRWTCRSKAEPQCRGWKWLLLLQHKLQPEVIVEWENNWQKKMTKIQFGQAWLLFPLMTVVVLVPKQLRWIIKMSFTFWFLSSDVMKTKEKEKKFAKYFFLTLSHSSRLSLIYNFYLCIYFYRLQISK